MNSEGIHAWVHEFCIFFVVLDVVDKKGVLKRGLGSFD